MEHVINPHAFAPDVVENRSRVLTVAVLVSILCHGIFFAAVMILPRKSNPRIMLPAVVNVDLVSLPSSAPAPASAPAKAVVAETAPVTLPPSITKPRPELKKPQPPPAVAPKPEPIKIPEKPKIKTSLKKKTFKPAKVVKSAMTELEKKIEEERPSQVAEAIERLKTTVKDKNPINEAIGKIEAKVATHGSGGRGGVAGGEEASLIKIYQTEIAFQIQKNWNFAKQLGGNDANLVADIFFDVMPDGQIKHVTFAQHSGNRYLDESALRAIGKSNPVRPFPPGINEPFLRLGISFTEAGIQ